MRPPCRQKSTEPVRLDQTHPVHAGIGHCARARLKRNTNTTDRQVFWLLVLPASCAFPFNSSWHFAWPASIEQWHFLHHAAREMKAATVPSYSGGTATDLHRLPYSSAGERPSRTPVQGVILPVGIAIATEMSTSKRPKSASHQRRGCCWREYWS